MLNPLPLPFNNGHKGDTSVADKVRGGIKACSRRLHRRAEHKEGAPLAARLAPQTTGSLHSVRIKFTAALLSMDNLPPPDLNSSTDLHADSSPSADCVVIARRGCQAVLDMGPTDALSLDSLANPGAHRTHRRAVAKG